MHLLNRYQFLRRRFDEDGNIALTTFENAKFGQTSILHHSKSTGNLHIGQNNHADLVHGTNMGPIWGRQDPSGPHVGPTNFVIWDKVEQSANVSQRDIHTHKDNTGGLLLTLINFNLSIDK